MSDIHRFTDGELLFWTSKWLRQIPVLPLLLGQQK